MRDRCARKGYVLLGFPGSSAGAIKSFRFLLQTRRRACALGRARQEAKKEIHEAKRGQREKRGTGWSARDGATRRRKRREKEPKTDKVLFALLFPFSWRGAIRIIERDENHPL